MLDDQSTKPRNATLSLIVDINEVRDQEEIRIDLRATKSECAALAKEIKILEINDLNAFLTIRLGARPDLYDIEGEILAHVVQECSVTLAPVKETVQENFSEMLTTSAETLGDPEDDGDMDQPIELIEHGKIDVGAIVAQWLVLALDPFPRSDAPPYAHIEVANQNAGQNAGDTHRPFEILGKIKDK